MLNNPNFGNLLQNPDKAPDFSQITMSLASPEKIRSWSYGEVTKAETINYRTYKPEEGGLFCAKIFGPMKDYECLCGKYKRVKYRNVICEKCGVEVTVERVRRERMGHINLASPVAHILFFKSLPSRLGLMADLTVRDIERILYFEVYIVTDPKRVEELDRGTLMNDERYQELKEQYGAAAFDIGIGAEGLRKYLRGINLDDEVQILQAEMEQTTSDTKRKKCAKRLRLMKNFRGANLQPDWMILDALPVLPPNLRPLVALDGGRFTSSDLNDLYRRVINRNNRLRKLIDINAPDIIVNNEKRMLQEAVDSLLDNGRRGKPAVAPNKRELKSLADVVKGKTGRFRQNLLGKRVDFSARSVIVVGPELKLHQCGIPKHMALNLFKPFVINMLVREGLANNSKQAKIKSDEPDAEVWDVLEKVIHQHPVLLNRAPTLHRLGIQAFEPVLIDGKAIQLHPLPCVAFNADFDGDQMAVHVPLSLEAQAEARVLMLSSNNILAPASGEPVILPSQDIVLGIYYATRKREGAIGGGMRFCDTREAELALAAKAVHLQAEIEVLLPKGRVEGDATAGDELVLAKTTVGRLLMLEFLPKQIPFAEINRTLKKKDLSQLVGKIFHRAGSRETVIFCDKLMNFGFRWSTRSGISICVNDLLIPDEKHKIIDTAAREMRLTQQQFIDGLLTADEKYNKSVDLWDKASENVTQVMMEKLSRETVTDSLTGKTVTEKGKAKTQESFNSLYMMADSGARGSKTQIKQLAGMRGLMTKPDGRIMETAITANFREGLNVLEYFLSTHGARKGLADTALKTANSGYLTRRLVDVSQDVVINEDNCGTDKGIVIRAALKDGEVIVPLEDRVLGRYLAKDVIHPQTSKKLFAADTLINEEEAKEIADVGVDEVVVRSPVTCENTRGICVKCYGRDLARGIKIRQGEAVGVVAAQSIGEPGTQLTMRTFHIGGAASAGAVVHSVTAKTDGTLRINNTRYVKNSVGENVVVSRGAEMSMSVVDADGREREKYRLQYGEKLKFTNGQPVKSGAVLSTRNPFRPIITEYGGKVLLEGLEEGVNARKQTDESTGREYLIITKDQQTSSKRPRRGQKGGVQMKILDDNGRPVRIQGTETEVIIGLPQDARLEVNSGDKVNAGDFIATMPQEARKSSDITGGLPRVAELFEAREPKEPSLLASADGRIYLLGIERTKQKMRIVAEHITKHQYSVAVKHAVIVEHDKKLKLLSDMSKGDMLTCGARMYVGVKVQTAKKAFRVQEGEVCLLVTPPKTAKKTEAVGKAGPDAGEAIIGKLLRRGSELKKGDHYMMPKDKNFLRWADLSKTDMLGDWVRHCTDHEVLTAEDGFVVPKDKFGFLYQPVEAKAKKAKAAKGKSAESLDAAKAKWLKKGDGVSAGAQYLLTTDKEIKRLAKLSKENLLTEWALAASKPQVADDGFVVPDDKVCFLLHSGRAGRGEGRAKFSKKDNDAFIANPMEADVDHEVRPLKKGNEVRKDELFLMPEMPDEPETVPIDGKHSWSEAKAGKRTLFIHPVEDITVPKGRTILPQDGEPVKKGEEIVEGEANPHEILAARGREKLASHIVDEVQSVYRLQGVTINDKHIEVIVRQMLRSVTVTDPGESVYLEGDQILRSVATETNLQLEAELKKPIVFEEKLLGITKASLATDSFISAASFQETTRVLTEAAVSGQCDKLRGLKENVIVGRLIPAGTGFVHYQQAKKKDHEEAEMIMQNAVWDETTPTAEADAGVAQPDS